MHPKVSVITPVYNLEEIALETVHSVLRQTYSDLELIVVDDGSTDRTAELIESVADPRLKLIRAPHSGLPAAGRNRAWELARGDFIAIADADDVWLPNKLARQIEFFERHPSVGVVHTGYHHLIDGEVVELPLRRHEPETLSAAEALPRMIVNNFVCTPTTVLRRSVVESQGPLFDTDPLLCGPEDFDLWLRLCERGVEFGYIAEPLVLYRIRATSVSRNLIRNWRGNLRVFEKAQERAPQMYAAHLRLVRDRLATNYRNLGRMKLIEGLPGGLADAWHAVTFNPLSWKAWGWTLLGLGGTGLVRSIVTLRGEGVSPAAGQPSLANSGIKTGPGAPN
jgi:glycosyltransferase involved in cell wall biosynthesis